MCEVLTPVLVEQSGGGWQSPAGEVRAASPAAVFELWEQLRQFAVLPAGGSTCSCCVQQVLLSAVLRFNPRRWQYGDMFLHCVFQPVGPSGQWNKPFIWRSNDVHVGKHLHCFGHIFKFLHDFLQRQGLFSQQESCFMSRFISAKSLRAFLLQFGFCIWTYNPSTNRGVKSGDWALVRQTRLLLLELFYFGCSWVRSQ